MVAGSGRLGSRVVPTTGLAATHGGPSAEHHGVAGGRAELLEQFEPCVEPQSGVGTHGTAVSTPTGPLRPPHGRA